MHIERQIQKIGGKEYGPYITVTGRMGKRYFRHYMGHIRIHEPIVALMDKRREVKAVLRELRKKTKVRGLVGRPPLMEPVLREIYTKAGYRVEGRTVSRSRSAYYDPECVAYRLSLYSPKERQRAGIDTPEDLVALETEADALQMRLVRRGIKTTRHQCLAQVLHERNNKNEELYDVVHS